MRNANILEELEVSVLFLYPLSLLYRGAVLVRNSLFDRGLLEVRRLPVPVVSVGNLSAGGTGKTSLVRFLARKLGKRRRVAVLLRGYRRESEGLVVVSDGERIRADVRRAGDEAFLLAKSLRGVPVVVCGDRFRGGLYAVEELGAELILLDDGFQHRRLHRDVDVVLLKKKDLSDRLLPAGLLREPVDALRRADALVLSYQETDPFDFSFEGKPVFRMFREFCCLRRPDFSRTSLRELENREVTVFAGLGDNEQFFRTVESLGLKVKERISFPDHHHYRDFRPRRGEVYLTTLKDMVKLPPCENLYALDFKLRVEGLPEFVAGRIGVQE